MEDALRSSEEYSPTTKLVELPEAGLTISGYQGGIPFPNPANPSPMENPSGLLVPLPCRISSSTRPIIRALNFNCTLDGFGNAYLLFSAALPSQYPFGPNRITREAKLHKPERWQEDSTRNFGATVIYPPPGEETTRAPASENRRPIGSTNQTILGFYGAISPIGSNVDRHIARWFWSDLGDSNNTISPFCRMHRTGVGWLS